MIQYITLILKLLNLQHNKLKSGIKNSTEATLNLPSNVIGNSDNETNSPNKLLLTNTQISKIRKTVANNSSTNIKFSKIQLSKTVQSERNSCRPTSIAIFLTGIEALKREITKV